MQPRILLTGATGQVGFELQRTLAPLGELVLATRDGGLPAGGSGVAFDLAEPAALVAVLDRLQPRIVVNPAAYTAVDRAESEPALARRVNVDAVEAIAHWCRRSGALLVHFSTDYVFDGSATRPWREDAPTAPLGVYGRSKRDGEDALRASGAPHLILRTAWVYAARGGNFLRTMLRLGGQRDTLGVVADQFGAPTPARWIAAATAALLARLGPDADPAALAADSLGTLHLAAAGETSWHGLAEAIFAAAVAAGLLSRAPDVRPIATADYPTPARRPAYSVLDGTRLRQRHALQLPDWRIGVREVIAELASTSPP